MEKYGTTNDNIIRRMRIACRVTKARTQIHTLGKNTDTHTPLFFHGCIGYANASESYVILVCLEPVGFALYC